MHIPSMRYDEIYGSTRKERAHRLATNQPPYYTLAPRTGTYPNGATFTDNFRYVEDIQDAVRNYICVRSQKFCKNYRKIYNIQVPGGLDILRTGIFHYRGWTCNCNDTHTCKHILAVYEKYRKTLRF